SKHLQGMTQKYLGIAAGFDEKTVDVRMAQYEAGTRTPKDNLVNSPATALEISPEALTVPDIDSYIGLTRTLFAPEDLYGLKINNLDGELCLTLDKSKGSAYFSMFKMLSAWQKEFDTLKSGEIIKDEYDTWRYNYPRIETDRAEQRLDVIRTEKDKT
ncbi:MAG: putative transcriptional regulator, partial [Clostridia bacterium]|nr:putative transcriptional regulator [Clostridia bacterium]